MRVVFIGIDSPFSLPSLLRLAERFMIVGVIESKPKTGPPRRRSRLAAAARELNVPYQIDRRNCKPWLTELNADILCVAGMARLLKPDEYCVPRHGAINVHPSLLPNYRGPDPFFWQARSTDLRGGVTVHRIDEGVDTGDILAQEEFQIELGEPFNELRDRAAARGAELLVRACEDLHRGTARPQPQRDFPCATPARNVTPDDWTIDWNTLPIERAWHFLRAAPDVNPTLPRTPGKGNWLTGGFRLVETAGILGSLGTDAEGDFLFHPDGKIRLRFRPARTFRTRLFERVKRYFRRSVLGLS